MSSATMFLRKKERAVHLTEEMNGFIFHYFLFTKKHLFAVSFQAALSSEANSAATVIITEPTNKTAVRI